MRVKIVEGMMMGKVIITTTLGKEGIEGEHKKEILVADTVSGFLDCIAFCVQHPDQANEIGRHAEEKAAAQFNPREVATRMMDIYYELLTTPHYRADPSTVYPAKS